MLLLLLLIVLVFVLSGSAFTASHLRNRQILWIAGEGMITRRPW
jgi:hypothetical protein